MLPSSWLLPISRAIHYFPALLRSVPESLVRSQFQRSGAERFWQWWEHCNFSRYSLFLRRSAPLLASIIGTFPSSNRAERNAFDNVPLMKNNLTEHCIMLHGSFIFPRSAPFRSVLQWWWVTHLNIGICSLRFYYFPSPFRFASLLPLLLFRDILTHWQQIPK